MIFSAVSSRNYHPRGGSRVTNCGRRLSHFRTLPRRTTSVKLYPGEESQEQLRRWRWQWRCMSHWSPSKLHEIHFAILTASKNRIIHPRVDPAEKPPPTSSLKFPLLSLRSLARMPHAVRMASLFIGTNSDEGTRGKSEKLLRNFALLHILYVILILVKRNKKKQQKVDETSVYRKYCSHVPENTKQSQYFLKTLPYEVIWNCFASARKFISLQRKRVEENYNICMCLYIERFLSCTIQPILEYVSASDFSRQLMKDRAAYVNPYSITEWLNQLRCLKKKLVKTGNNKQFNEKTVETW